MIVHLIGQEGITPSKYHVCIFYNNSVFFTNDSVIGGVAFTLKWSSTSRLSTIINTVVV